MNQNIQNNPVTILVDGRQVQALPGTSVLDACLKAGIYIPHLCMHESDTVEMSLASCRLCFVEIEGVSGITTSCTETVRDGMVVHTNTPEVRNLQKTALKLLLSAHKIDCKNCPANGDCSLQEIAKFLGTGLNCKPFPPVFKDVEVEQSHPLFDYYSNRCVLCGHCIKACRSANKQPALSFYGRGFKTVIGFFEGAAVNAETCAMCRSCIDSCPVGALVERSGKKRKPAKKKGAFV